MGSGSTVRSPLPRATAEQISTDTGDVLIIDRERDKNARRYTSTHLRLEDIVEGRSCSDQR